MLSQSEFEYPVPRGQIALRPPAERGDSRLLLLPAGGDDAVDHHFSELPSLLRAGDLLVLNDTRVLPARLYGHKDTGGKLDILLERELDERHFLARLRRARSLRPGSRVWVAPQVWLQTLGHEEGLSRFRIGPAGHTLDRLLREHGHIPLPPYISRAVEAQDQARYQTVFARHPGAVAAPTAGLHFTTGLLEQLRERGISHCFITLHVGAGTFLSVRGRVEDHRMHSEYAGIDSDTVAAIEQTRRRRGRVIAVGTTVVRCLETAAFDGTLRPFSGMTDLFIRPGFRFRVVDMLITNFHWPETSLLVLVSAFAGYRRIQQAYAHAAAAGYRFYSYGDAMLLQRHAL